MIKQRPSATLSLPEPCAESTSAPLLRMLPASHVALLTDK